MNENFTYFNYFYAKLLSEKTKKKTEIVFVSIAIISFILHLSLILLVDFKVINLHTSSRFLNNPISSIYTPFSFILIYEVYLLVYYLPKSTTIYIGKQYEIITLIIIRRIFKDLTSLKFKEDWFSAKENILFATDLLATLVLFYLIFIFYKLNRTNEISKAIIQKSVEVTKFIDFKKVIAMILIPIFLVLSIYSLGSWIYESFNISQMVRNIKDINKIFFDEFFTILILIEVLLLLVSFFISDKFSKVIRNSGFIISTILIKLSFGTEGFLNTILIVVAVVFGVLILMIHNKYEVLEAKKITALEV
ncbi:hypothetical protein [Flavobacterium sp.]|uniref:hypothetical protein n=1 Tax=Flavobacterium sp. TaxID=239 RepID=UPI003751EE14